MYICLTIASIGYATRSFCLLITKISILVSFMQLYYIRLTFTAMESPDGLKQLNTSPNTPSPNFRIVFLILHNTHITAKDVLIIVCQYVASPKYNILFIIACAQIYIIYMYIQYNTCTHGPKYTYN